MVQFPLPAVEPGGPARVPRSLVLILAASLTLFTAGLTGVGYEALTRHGSVPIPRSQAEATAIQTIAESQRRTAPSWDVRHTSFHPYSATVSDSSGQQRIVSSWSSCASGYIGKELVRNGVLCPPPPVWAIEVQTSSRPADHRAFVEIDALSGAVLSWFIDDSLP